ncbi:MAG: T9SS type A sorting domain-containing protein [Candidatus Cloacimonetes bacterium]|nr:T9SS type A sorting domain-containing protein [Candidatus Cloacimonadota bacterium]
MKKIILILLAVFLFGLNLSAQSADTLNIQNGTIPTIDGIISTGEWDDAISLSFSAGSGANQITVTCYLKHNGIDTLYIAQDVPILNNGDQAFLWFDTLHNNGTTPQTDDYRLSGYFLDFPGYDGEVQGTGSSWGSWTNPSGWISASTGMGWSSDHGQIELAIAFEMLGITSEITSIIGFMIGFGDNPDQADYWVWPTTGQNNNPNTWVNLIFYDDTGIEDEILNSSLLILNLTNYPNPFNPSTTISFSFTTENTENTELVIYNLKGQKVRKYSIFNNQSSISWDGTDDLGKLVSSGIYFYKIKSGTKFSNTKKMLLLK